MGARRKQRRAFKPLARHRVYSSSAGVLRGAALAVRRFSMTRSGTSAACHRNTHTRRPGGRTRSQARRGEQGEWERFLACCGT
eukprot:6185439-Pleurochrysis_carterae.AAC.4